MQHLFLIGCGLSFLAAIGSLVLRPIHRALHFFVWTTLLGLSCNFLFALLRLLQLPAAADLFPVLPEFASFFRADGLSLFFLLVITSVAIPIIISSSAYLRPYLVQRAAVRSFLVSFSLLILSTQLLVFANHSIVFLIFWEMMTLMAYLGMLLEKEKEEVQKGSFIYFTVTHIATFFLYIFFFLLHNTSGSWLFTDFHLTPAAGSVFYLICGFGFLGFGIKAGFMPVHFWLPRAHPIAPAILSAFLSGIIIKTGIYGIFRVLEFCSPLPIWMGIVLLVVSMFSALFGVWYALAEHDIKKVLAYHSIENIGIIGIGLGLGVLGVTSSVQSLVWFGFGGALFHTFNHAIFKSLLFLGSGIICHNCQTRNMEKMGGIVHQAAWFVGLFLIGSIALSGIPPFNGFMSEFLIYKGFFNAASKLGGSFPLLMLLLAVGLAFVGGLAFVCFTKINSIMFLGTERTPRSSFQVSRPEYIALGILAALCIVLGVYPQPVLGIISSVITFNHNKLSGTPYTMFTHWEFLTVIFVSVVLTIVCVVIWKKFSTQQRISRAWGCGYPAQTPRMQYTASSYADGMNSIASHMLQIQKHVTPPAAIFPQASGLDSHAEDFAEKKLVFPLYRYIINKIDSFEFLSRTDIRFYISFMLFIAILYGGIAILWPY